MDYLHHPIPALVAIVIIFLLSLILLSGYNATIKVAGGIVLIVLLYKRFVHIKDSTIEYITNTNKPFRS